MRTRLRWQASLTQCGQASNSPSSPRSFARFGGGFKRAESVGPSQLAAVDSNRCAAETFWCTFQAIETGKAMTCNVFSIG